MSNVCQNCGNVSPAESRFCRFCGTRISSEIGQAQFEAAPPRPYAWKTDEFLTQTEPRQHAGAAPISRPARVGLADSEATQPLVAQRCAKCSGQYLPRIKRRISTTGWIVFAVLLVVFFPLFWVGFLIKEDVQMCPGCGARMQ